MSIGNKSPHSAEEVRIIDEDPNILGKEDGGSQWAWVDGKKSENSVDVMDEVPEGMTPEQHMQAARETEEEQELEENSMSSTVAALFDLSADDLGQAVMDAFERATGGTDIDKTEITGDLAASPTVTPSQGVDRSADVGLG